MTKETLSDMIFQDRMNVDVICADNVKNIIKKLKEEFCVCEFLKKGLKCGRCRMIDKIFGKELSK